MRKSIAGIALIGLLGCSLPSEQRGPMRSSQDAPQVLWIRTARLTPLDGEIGNGFAEGQYLTSGELLFHLRANLIPVNNGHYEAWVEKDGVPRNLGTLTLFKDEGVYTMSMREPVPIHDGAVEALQTIFVTWESDEENNGEPNEKILEGTFAVVGSD